MLETIQKFLEVVMIDIVMSGDNAVVIGLAVAGIAAHERKQIVALGIAAATVLRIALALIAVPLLKVVGLTLAGGFLLIWVAWEFWRELRGKSKSEHLPKESKTKFAALMQIVIADASMSLDNVLGVAGAAREHPTVLIFGLIVSIALMALASTFIANLIGKHRWIAYFGLLVIVYVALDMTAAGTLQIVNTAY